jgi:hypothetical protein
MVTTGVGVTVTVGETLGAKVAEGLGVGVIIVIDAEGDGVTVTVGEAVEVGEVLEVGVGDVEGTVVTVGEGLTAIKLLISVVPGIVETPGLAKLGREEVPSSKLTVPVADINTIFELADVIVAVVQEPLQI